MRAMLVAVSALCLSCTGSSGLFQPTVDEGLVIMKRVNFESPPEEKVETARELLAHAERYEKQLTASSSSDIKKEAKRLRGSERATASILMRDAASDYAKHKRVDNARNLYRSILSTFTDENEAGFRQSAEAALNRLDKEQAE